MAPRFCLKHKGFSLLELIVTVAILSVGIIIILQAFSFSAQATGLSCDYINAVFLAEDKMEELEFRERKKALTEEAMKDSWDKFTRSYSLKFDPDLNLYRLDLNVDWLRQHKQQNLNLKTYLK